MWVDGVNHLKGRPSGMRRAALAFLHHRRTRWIGAADVTSGWRARCASVRAFQRGGTGEGPPGWGAVRWVGAGGRPERAYQPGQIPRGAHNRKGEPMGGCGRHWSSHSARAGTGCRIGEEPERGSCRSEPSPVMGEGSEGVARARGGARMVPPKVERAA
jgi:hypothetical protein